MKTINKNEIDNQVDEILWHLQNKGTITTWEAIHNYGVTRLSAVIHTLRYRGHTIDSIPLKLKNRYGKQTTVSKYNYVEDFIQTKLL
tara:strand:- start:55 stop:315 length:261 start_codon:yes stop_codon:yes gene_type:complete